MTKNLSLGLNVVLLLAVAFLYFKVFSSKTTGKAAVETGKTSNTTAGGGQQGKIAYINIDSLQNGYTFYKTRKEEFERSQKAGTSELEEKQKRFQSRYAQLQQRAQSMTPQEQEAAMAELKKMENEIGQRKQAIESQLFQMGNDLKETVYKRLQDFLKEYNKDNRYSYILSYEPGFMFYQDSTLNITPDVIKGLNEAEKKGDK